MQLAARRRFITLALAACAAGFGPSRAWATAVTAASDDEELADGLPYGPTSRQRLDVYAPEEASQHARPVIVYFYGGSWQAGQRADSRGVADALAQRGFVAVTPDYRVYPETVFPGFLADAAASVRWARDHAHEFGGDPERIFVMGHSAGAHIAAMLATDGRYLQAQGMAKESLRGMIGLAGPYVAIPSEPHMGDIFPAAERAETLPIDFISGNEPPMLLATGTADNVVDPRNSERFAAALRAHDDSVELKRYPGYDHGRIVDAFTASAHANSPILADVAAFIGAH
ncbi:alpha/beta hydrolase [Caballeronia sp. TF1N1]|uniref:alpha/beta hydrolase n=1 Tax=Caballeronia sp. TF1N1 TaxID=2878153 RepID=UPI001FD0FE39|nr:alpha/beta hydrolase [Caballeronia sp. TF1N1]